MWVPMAHPSPGFGKHTQSRSGIAPEFKPCLEWLIAPISKSAFFEQYFEKQALLVKRDEPDYFAGLLSLDEIDRVITTLGQGSHEIILKNAKRELTTEDYMIDDALDVAKVYQLFGEGSTITLAFLDTVVPPLTQFCRSLENEFTCPFQTNVYLTPPNAQGAKIHYDTHDVFVMQVAGSKKWTIYGTPVELPLPRQDYDATVHQPGAPTMEFELEAGDVAYLPRGAVHEARSTDTVSLHITAGILRYTWTDLLLEFAAGAALRDPAFRKSLPPGFARAEFDRAQARETLRKLLQRAADSDGFDAALDHFVDDFLSKCPPRLRGQMAQVAAADQLTPESIAGVRDSAIFRILSSDDSLTVEAYGRRISLPASAAPAVRFALSHERFAIRELPGELDDASKLTIVRRLIQEGLVEAALGE